MKQRVSEKSPVRAAVCAAALLLTAPAGCVPSAEEIPPPSQCAALTRQDAGRPIRLRVGDCARISLDENPTTGYRWQFRIAPAPDAPEGETAGSVEPIDDRYCASQQASDEPLCGAGGVRILTVRGARPGRVGVFGTYRREWEPDSPAAEVGFLFDVR